MAGLFCDFINRQVQADDLIMLAAVDEEISEDQLTQDMLDALAASNNKGVVPNISRVSPRLFERFARMMKLETIIPKRASNSLIAPVEGKSTQWNLELGGQFPPDYLWLKWSEKGVDGKLTIREEAFPVRKPSDANALESNVQALNRDNLLIRTQEAWRMLGYALGSAEPGQKPEKFLEWPQPAPTYVITFKDFPGGEQQRQNLVNALRQKIGEFIIVKSPEQTVRLISVDLAPSKRDRVKVTDGRLFLVKFNRIRERIAEEDQAVWALFPLTETQVKELITKMRSANVNKKVAQLAKEETDYPFVELEERDINREHPEGWPVTTGRFNDKFAPAWYVIPAQPDASGMVEQFRRTLEIGEITPPEEERWVALMYIFNQKQDEGFPWRAVRLPEAEQKRNAPYSTPYVVAFKMSDLEALAKYKYKSNSDLDEEDKAGQNKPDAKTEKQKTTDE